MRHARLAAALVAAGLLSLAPTVRTQSGQDSADVLSRIAGVNARLRAAGLGIAVQQVDFFTIGVGRPSVRIHQAGTRWVAGDPRRLADGNALTYLVDVSDGATTSGLTTAQTESAIDRAFNTWQEQSPLKKLALVKRFDFGEDPDIFDFYYGFGAYGNPLVADIVNAGWLPREYFEAVGGPGGGRGILAFSVTFIFIDLGTGAPTDINRDNYLDTALNEVYYNDTFGNPAGDRSGNPWGIDTALPGIDVETIALHENGHSLGLGHFGPPPVALLNPVYGGIMQAPLAVDNAGMATIWAAWPR
jgi:hypothetical protein